MNTVFIQSHPPGRPSHKGVTSQFFRLLQAVHTVQTVFIFTHSDTGHKTCQGQQKSEDFLWVEEEGFYCGTLAGPELSLPL